MARNIRLINTIIASLRSAATHDSQGGVWIGIPLELFARHSSDRPEVAMFGEYCGYLVAGTHLLGHCLAQKTTPEDEEIEEFVLQSAMNQRATYTSTVREVLTARNRKQRKA